MRSRIGKKGTVLLAVLVLAAAAVAGGALAAVAAHDTAATTTTINVTETNYKIALSKSSGIPVGYVVFVVKNSSTIAHHFGVKGTNFTTKSILALIQPGQTKTLKVLFTHKGTYTAFCKLHLALGMKKAFTLGGTSTTSTTHTTTTTHTWA
jgi:plastocyanin